ncbi:hypothetical protein DDR33_24885 [Pararcticibacter amylolyticus]|uniref:Uncharacterized protein n=1 Tax=Pararcticibacter amylolyticus TaxID=2173175 RepID=A0A2U2P965_9SPHI|nr:hypothetical protein DDR33_24885 [Pararcticibacter amylolyticus]
MVEKQMAFLFSLSFRFPVKKSSNRCLALRHNQSNNPMAHKKINENDRGHFLSKYHNVTFLKLYCITQKEN